MAKIQNFANFFQPLKNDKPFVKMALQGFAGSGKTYLSALIAIGIWEKMGKPQDKPILVFDTEKAFSTLKDLFDDAGVPVMVRKSRTLADLETAFDAVEAGFGCALIIDSITHIWLQYCADYLAAKNQRARAKNRNARLQTRMHFPDWAYLKPNWKSRFSDRIVDGLFHVIFTGRAGYEYAHEEDEDTKKRELIKTGIRMKAETETAFEPDVLVNMETHQDLLSKEKHVYRIATIIKDRYRVVDGKEFKNPTFKDFEEMVLKAMDGEAVKERAETRDKFTELDSDDKNWAKLRDVEIEEITGILQQMGLGTSQADKTFKVNLLDRAFNTKSWTKVQSMSVTKLQDAKPLIEALKNKWLDYCQEQVDSKKKIDTKQRDVILGEIFPKEDELMI